MENAELLKRLMDLTKKKNPPPEGWMAADQWAEKWNLSPRQARTYLLLGVKAGVMEREMFRPEGARQALPHFREVGCGGSVAARGCERTSGTSR